MTCEKCKQYCAENKRLKEEIKIGKMNEKSWIIRGGKDCTVNQNKRNKKDRPHYIVKERTKFNQKKRRVEKTKKGSREIVGMRCS